LPVKGRDFFAVGAVGALTAGINDQVVALRAHPKESPYRLTHQSHLRITKFLNLPAVQADEMIMLLAA
jgi:hypothetical protein